MTSTYETILLEIRDRVATLTLNRPDSRNALNLAMCGELTDAMTRIAADDEVNAVLVLGAGKVFCAGADLKERQGMSSAEMTARRVRAFTAYASIEKLPQPVVAAVQGAAFGSGCEIASACDFILAAEDATFCYPEVGWGTVGATQRLPRAVGVRMAKELLFTSRKFSAVEAREIGLVNRLFPAAELEAAARAMVADMASKSAITMRLTKRSIEQGLATTREGAMAVELYAIEENMRGSDWRKAISAFGAAKPGAAHADAAKKEAGNE
jgi:enoyl-CoA hydratase